MEIFDEQGYPTDEYLERLKTFDILTEGIYEYIELIRCGWEYADWGFVYSPDKRELELHTAGWSGNEDIIRAIRCNMFWGMFWLKSERGGHYYFKWRDMDVWDEQGHPVKSTRDV